MKATFHRIELTIIVLFICSLFQNCIGQDCNNIPKSFSSYAQAKQIVKSASFSFKESKNTSKSSWIRGAHYFSCDSKKGFFLIETDRGEYIHQDVPRSIWEEFKNASSFGSYYNIHFKGKYLLNLKE